MPGYRLYYLDDTKRIRHAVEFECASDSDAHRVALERSDGRGMELWCGARIVRKYLPATEQD